MVCLQQPSYVSRAVVKSASQTDRSSMVASLMIACPLGLALKFSTDHEENWKVEELTPCCLAKVSYTDTCEKCKEQLACVPFNSLVILPQLDSKPKKEDERVEDDSSMNQFETELIARLERQGIKPFSAFLIACEICSLIFEIAKLNSVQSEVF